MHRPVLLIAGAIAFASCSSDKSAIPPAYSALAKESALATQLCTDVLKDGAPAPSVEMTKAHVPCKLPDGSTQLNVVASLPTPCEVDWIDKHYWRPGVGVVHTGDPTALGVMAKACA